ncbi:mycofactocin biosynthesis chaperone MftB [Pseudofrankia saprophytica]|uniref:mycofactocin biosynthesis chaperone MftB n=1 Tax=Pseudofrankia saprophytica TaxID=298655 RepID=UPI000234BB02|nr:mycofactocin biosynthesis chaperone MftB [Pseudofrankia saprophytica]
MTGTTPVGAPDGAPTSAPTPAHALARPSGASFDPARPYRLHPKVALRPERFGALAYSYDTRRLSLLKDVDLVAVVRALADAPSAGDALAAVPAAKRPAVERALARLVETGFVQPR